MTINFLPKKSFLIMALSCLFVQLYGQEIKQISLAEAISYAYDNSITIRNSQINIADAEAQIKERLAVGLPQINGEIGFQRYLAVPTQVLPEAFVATARDPVTGELPEGFSREVTFLLKNQFAAGINMNALIFDGSYFTAVKAARAYREYVQQELRVKQRDVRNQVIEAYLPSLILAESLETLEKNMRVLDEVLYGVKKTYEEGFAEQLDVDRLELTKANLQTEKENLQRQQEVALNALKFAMGFPLQEELKITDDIDAILQEASGEELTAPINFFNRPQYQLIEKGLELSEYNIDVNKKGYLPSVGAIASYQYAWQGNSADDGFWFPTALIGLQVNVPIFDGFDKKAKIQRAQLEMEKAKNQQEEFGRAIVLEVENARVQYLNGRERVANQRKNLALAEKIYNTTQIKYKEGVGSSLEMREAENSLYETQQNLIQAKYDLLVAKMNLNKALGGEY